MVPAFHGQQYAFPGFFTVGQHEYESAVVITALTTEHGFLHIAGFVAQGYYYPLKGVSFHGNSKLLAFSDSALRFRTIIILI